MTSFDENNISTVELQNITHDWSVGLPKVDIISKYHLTEYYYRKLSKALRSKGYKRQKYTKSTGKLLNMLQYYPDNIHAISDETTIDVLTDDGSSTEENNSTKDPDTISVLSEQDTVVTHSSKYKKRIDFIPKIQFSEIKYSGDEPEVIVKYHYDLSEMQFGKTDSPEQIELKTKMWKEYNFLKEKFDIYTKKQLTSKLKEKDIKCNNISKDDLVLLCMNNDIDY